MVTIVFILLCQFSKNFVKQIFCYFLLTYTLLNGILIQQLLRLPPVCNMQMKAFCFNTYYIDKLAFTMVMAMKPRTRIRRAFSPRQNLSSIPYPFFFKDLSLPTLHVNIRLHISVCSHEPTSLIQGI